MKLAYKLIFGYLLVASIASCATYFALRSYNHIDPLVNERSGTDSQSSERT